MNVTREPTEIVTAAGVNPVAAIVTTAGSAGPGVGLVGAVGVVALVGVGVDSVPLHAGMAATHKNSSHVAVLTRNSHLARS